TEEMPHQRPQRFTKEEQMKENEAAKHILDAAFVVHSKLGPGLLETVYEVVLAHELRKRGVRAERQKPILIHYEGLIFEEGFRADLVVESAVIAELKSGEALTALHGKQLLTQLRLSGLKLGLLINFGEPHLKNGIRRVINGELEDENISF
ncbi:MAG: GxxExxY protein, partial [Chthoniobacterales bacterium]